VQRLAALLRRLPLVPLPGGGRALVQPIHQDDVTRCILASLDHGWTTAQTLVIAGHAPLPYAEFVRAIARAAGMRPPRIIPLPAAFLMAATALTVLPGLPRIRAAEIRRLLEDKNFDIAPMRATLGIDPVTLDSGLARLFGPD
jgi:nucleoside-diphosphate-sugar epimerase